MQNKQSHNPEVAIQIAKISKYFIIFTNCQLRSPLTPYTYLSISMISHVCAMHTHGHYIITDTCPYFTYISCEGINNGSHMGLSIWTIFILLSVTSVCLFVIGLWKFYLWNVSEHIRCYLSHVCTSTCVLVNKYI